MIEAPARTGTEIPAPHEPQWFGHPRGLSTLFFTEMWERFSYYGMRAILILYITASIPAGGLGYSVADGAAIYGWYTMFAWGMAIPGGWIADRFLGHYRAVLVGGIIITCGHFSLAIPTVTTFFLGLVLVVLGTGLLKPNVSTMVGSLYGKDDLRRDSGFSLFYMGINFGAFISPLVCGYLGQRVGWHWGFGAAGIGMTLGLVQYALGRKHLKLDSPARTTSNTSTEKKPGPAFSREEWKRLLAIGFLMAFAIICFAGTEQQGSSLNLFADRYTRLTVLGWDIPSSWFQSLPALMVVLLSPVFGWLWIRLRHHEPSSPAKFASGLLLLSFSFLLLMVASHVAQTQGVRVSPWWLIGVFLIQTLGELCVGPVGLSVVTKLAPARVVGMMMGVWFLSLSAASKISGMVAGLFERLPLEQVFAWVFAAEFTAFLLLLALIKPMRRWMGGVH